MIYTKIIAIDVMNNARIHCFGDGLLSALVFEKSILLQKVFLCIVVGVMS